MIGGSVTASVKTNLSLHHIRSAAWFAGRATPIEAAYTWPATEEILLQHQTFSTSAVISAVCATEAYLNEVHLDIVDGNVDQLGKIGERLEMFRNLWDTAERLPTLRKYEWAFTLGTNSTLDRGAKTYQNVADLIALRNELVHYRPEWSHTPLRSTRLEKRLFGRFPLNRLSMPSQLFIPYRCLGAGCAAWAVESAYAFVSSFSDSLTLRHSWAPFRGQLDQLLTAPAQ